MRGEGIWTMKDKQLLKNIAVLLVQHTG